MGFSLINHPPSRGTQETSISGRITIPTLWHRGSSSDSSELIKKRKREMKQKQMEAKHHQKGILHINV
jgi:hypothetical protein